MWRIFSLSMNFFSPLHHLIIIPIVGFLDDLLLDVENLFSGDSPPAPSPPLHLLLIIIIIVVVGVVG